MKKQLIIFLSILIAISLISGGYSLWGKTLTIIGSIEVLPPPTPVPEPQKPETMVVSDAVYGSDTSVIDSVYGEDQMVIEVESIDLENIDLNDNNHN